MGGNQGRRANDFGTISHKRSLSSPNGARALSPTLSLGRTKADGSSPRDCLVLDEAKEMEERYNMDGHS